MGKNPADLTAYDAIFKVYHWWIVLTEEAYNQSFAALQHAAQVAPHSPHIKALLTEPYLSDSMYGLGLFEHPLETAEQLLIDAQHPLPSIGTSRIRRDASCIYCQDFYRVGLYHMMTISGRSSHACCFSAS